MGENIQRNTLDQCVRVCKFYTREKCAKVEWSKTAVLEVLKLHQSLSPVDTAFPSLSYVVQLVIISKLVQLSSLSKNYLFLVFSIFFYYTRLSVCVT